MPRAPDVATTSRPSFGGAATGSRGRLATRASASRGDEHQRPVRPWWRSRSRATPAAWPCWEVEEDPDVRPSYVYIKARGKTVPFVGFEMEKEKENKEIMENSQKPPKSKKFACPTSKTCEHKVICK
jgi:hypothetical protein